MRPAPAFVTLATAACLSLPASAATLSPGKGELFVNRGDGYKRVTATAQIAAGDQVIAQPGGSGRIIFSDGCATNIEPGVVFTVAPRSPCERVAGHVETGGSLKDDPIPEVEERTERRHVIGALLAAGIPIGIMLLRDHDKKILQAPNPFATSATR